MTKFSRHQKTAACDFKLHKRFINFYKRLYLKNEILEKMVSYGNRYFGLAKESSVISNRAAQQYFFCDLCHYLDSHPNLTQPQFNKLLEDFYSKVPDDAIETDENFSAYPLVRLILPEKDQRKSITEVCLIQHHLSVYFVF